MRSVAEEFSCSKSDARTITRRGRNLLPDMPTDVHGDRVVILQVTWFE